MAVVLPGFRPALGFTLVYLSLLVLIPLSGVFIKTAGLSWEQYLAHGHESARAGVVPADDWRVRHRRADQRDLRHAVGLGAGTLRVPRPAAGRRADRSPAGAANSGCGIALTSLYAENGWLGSVLAPGGMKVAFTPLGIIIALTFIGLPFVVRTVQPVLQDLENEVEDAAASLGATRSQTFRRIIFPTVLPALVTGTALAFARALGEYGSIVFISGNLPLKTEVTTLLIMTKLEQYDYRGATALATVMLGLSFVMLFAINMSQAWLRRRNGALEEAA